MYDNWNEIRNKIIEEGVLIIPSHQFYPCCEFTTHTDFIIQQAFKNNTRILFDYHAEGYSAKKIQEIQQYIINLTSEDYFKNDVYFVSGARSAEIAKLNNPNIFDGLFIHEWLDHFSTLSCDHKFENKTKTFMCLNRIVRPHRIVIINEMIKRNLLIDSHVSFFKNSGYNNPPMNWKQSTHGEFTSAQLNEFKTNIDSFDGDLTIDESNPNINKAHNVTSDLYETSLINVVTETVSYEYRDLYDSIFMSEKIFKPVLAEQPFILVGQHKALEDFRKYGFKTFAPYINEGYDNIKDPYDRIIAIADEMERINNLPVHKKKEIFDGTRVITKHNRFIFSHTDFSNFKGLANNIKNALFKK